MVLCLAPSLDYLGRVLNCAFFNKFEPLCILDSEVGLEMMFVYNTNNYNKASPQGFLVG